MFKLSLVVGKICSLGETSRLALTFRMTRIPIPNVIALPDNAIPPIATGDDNIEEEEVIVGLSNPIDPPIQCKFSNAHE